MLNIVSNFKSPITFFLLYMSLIVHEMPFVINLWYIYAYLIEFGIVF